MIISGGGIATSRVLEQVESSAWVRVRLRDGKLICHERETTKVLQAMPESTQI